MILLVVEVFLLKKSMCFSVCNYMKRCTPKLHQKVGTFIAVVAGNIPFNYLPALWPFGHFVILLLFRISLCKAAKFTAAFAFTLMALFSLIYFVWDSYKAA